MAGYQHRAAFVPGEADDKCADFLNTGRVEAVGGFVEDEYLRVACESHRDAEALLHAKRVVLNQLVHVVAQAHELDRTLRIFGRGAEEPRRDLHVFATGQMRVCGRRFDE